MEEREKKNRETDTSEMGVNFRECKKAGETRGEKRMKEVQNRERE